MKVALLGYGKMGKAIEALINETGKHSVVLKVNSRNLNDLTIEILKQADVAIEFSRPNTVLNNINLCFDADIPIVVGTTGWRENLETIKQQCIKKKQALLYASNFSVGVNLFFKMNQLVNQLFADYDAYNVSIEEIHHIQKIDAPSGTAISLKGTHTVTWQSANDQVSIRHEAFSRNGFAKGAILAAEWLPGKTGCFTMNDVLNI